MCAGRSDEHEQQREPGADNEVARQLRRDLSRTGTLMVNLIGSPGVGKTTLLEVTIRRLKQRFRLAALEGDVASDLDGERICRLGVPARQILTGGHCHLDASQVEYELRYLGSRPPEIVLVENVGNLICPAEYDLGEDFKVALLSVAEGEQTPYKYPAVFARAAVTVITKSDLLPVVAFDPDRVSEQITALNHDAVVILTSAVTGQGIGQWCRLLERQLMRKAPTTIEPHARLDAPRHS
jgi:hydrogenase nickel incorporation protein HypB